MTANGRKCLLGQMVPGRTVDSDLYDRMISLVLKIIELTFQQFFEIRKIVLLHCTPLRYLIPFSTSARWYHAWMASLNESKTQK